MKFETISVVGLGYVGLPTAAVIASRRKQVIGVDVNQHAVDIINKGQVPIEESELDTIVHAAVNGGFLRASTMPEPADAFLIAVPTPFKGDHEPDLSYIESASLSVARVLKKGDLVILESTSPVGTTEKMSEWLADARPDLTFPQSHKEESDIRVAYCPERVIPGHTIRELVKNDRVIGGMTPKCSESAAALYKIFVEAECAITSARVAEMAKLTENSFRDVNIAFANELSIICDKLDIDIWELIRLANQHPRVDILQPGPGVGGHCIAVDPWFIISQVPNKAKLIRQARTVNDEKSEWVLNKIMTELDIVRREKGVSSVNVALLGLSYKSNIGDLRESPALYIAERVVSELEALVSIVEPNISELPASLARADKVNLEDAQSKADLIVVLVAHKQFKDLSNDLKEGQRLISAINLNLI